MTANKVTPSLITFNTLINAYFKMKCYKHAWDLFEQLKKTSDIKPDCYTYTTMINGIKSMNKVKNTDVTKAL